VGPPRRGASSVATDLGSAAVIEKLLSPVVECVEAFGDIPAEPVFPGEEDLVANAVEGRRREFVTARRCAREALERLGYSPAPIRPGARREPRWPAGVIGSITHCAGYRAAAVARRSGLAGIGIDGEPHGPLPNGVAEVVAGPDERAALAELARTDPAVHWDRLLFSAKESIYKAWYPLCGSWLGFEDVRLHIDPSDGSFIGHLLVNGARLDGRPPLTRLHGRYLVDRNLVLTAVTVATV
jgi:4'-phosphopantetheinyl transferase EntD